MQHTNSSRRFASSLVLCALCPLALAATRVAAQGFVETHKLLASDGGAGDQFGEAAALDGDTLVVGADNAAGQGAAYVYERDSGGSGNWGEVAKLVSSDLAAGDLFGHFVALDGDTVAVGAQGNDDAGADSGSVYIFYRDQGGAGNWGEVIKINASDGAAGDWFGFCVALSGDTLVVGAARADANGVDSGSAYVFERNQGGADNWGEVVKITGSDTSAVDEFGSGVTVDGDTIAVGAWKEDTAAFDGGAVYVFGRDQGGANNWGEVVKRTAVVADGARYGYAVSLSTDTLAVGAYGFNSTAGAGFVLERNQGGADNWGEAAMVSASDGAPSAWFGYSISIDADTLLVGAVFDSGAIGAGYVYGRNEGGAGNWGEIAKLVAADGAANDRNGFAVSVSGDTMVTGAYFDDDLGADAGSAFVFDPPPAPRDVTLVDIDGDGALDIATADLAEDQIGVRLNDGSGAFAARTDLGLGGSTGPIAVAGGDLDDDGSADDLATACSGSNDVVVITDPNGTPATQSIASGGLALAAIAVGDLDGTGPDDIVVGRLGEPFAGGGGLGLILNHAAATELLTPAAPVAKVGLCDLDQDGDLDIVALVQSVADSIELFQNDGLGGFTQTGSIALPTSTLANGLCCGDIDEDGDVDVSVVLPVLFPTPSQNLRVFLNAGAGSMNPGDFTAQPDVASAGTFGVSISCGDLEDDTVDGFFGRIDVAVVNAGSGDVTLHHGYDVGTQAFDSVTNPTVGTNPIAVAIADLDADGGADIVVANQGSADVTVILSAQPALAQTYGPGCNGINGVPVLTGDNLPTIGGVFSMTLTNGREFAPALALFGVGTLNAPLGASCALLVPPTLAQPRFLDGAGGDTFAFGVPLAIPAGADVMVQYLVFDTAGAFAATASLSNGLRLQTGN